VVAVSFHPWPPRHLGSCPSAGEGWVRVALDHFELF
jgi:hypothetical protein